MDPQALDHQLIQGSNRWRPPWEDSELKNHDKLLQDSNKAGEQSWDLLNKDLRKLREDHSASAENLEDFKEETCTSFKDVANAQ